MTTWPGLLADGGGSNHDPMSTTGDLLWKLAPQQPFDDESWSADTEGVVYKVWGGDTEWYYKIGKSGACKVVNVETAKETCERHQSAEPA